MRLFVTGASGFLGTKMLPLLSKQFSHVYALVRPASIEAMRARWKDLKNVEFVEGDIVQPGVLLDPTVAPLGLREVTDILHMAALYDLQATVGDLYVANVVGTQNVLDFADTLPALQRFQHVSTIAIAGSFRGYLKETMFNVGQSFEDGYARTKYRSEGLIGAWKRNDVKRIFYRMGVIVGDSTTGEIPKIDGPYYLISSIMHNKLLWETLARGGTLPLPFDSDAHLPLIPVDVAAEQIAHMSSHPVAISGKLRTYHLVGAQVAVGSILRRIFAEFDLNPRIVPIPRMLAPAFAMDLVGLPKALLAYMYSRCTYDTAHVIEDYPELRNPPFDEYAERLFAYVKANWSEKIGGKS